ncbi:hypothetical protein [Lewinella sp. IMCC34183]|uniref:hypothetical protein n=1 Tax=Lewinella sp. IMCC34183 TaxID=2248762 RepID=UPI000E27A449|nr:hypothetical protein [Lewinella sp. IMCC34183]
MKALFLVSLFGVSLSLTSCLAALAVHNVTAPDTGMAAFSVPAGATVKVVTADFDQSLQSFVEQALAGCGLTVVASGELTGTVAAARLPYGQGDTTGYRLGTEPVVRQLYDEPSSDLLLRYASTGEALALNSFSASLIDPATGRVLTTFARSYALPRAPERVMTEFAEAFRAAVE